MLKITAPLTVPTLQHARPGEAAQISAAALARCAQGELLPVAAPLVSFLSMAFARHDPEKTFIRVLRQEGNLGATIWALSYDTYTAWIGWRDGQYGFHTEEPRGLMKPTVLVERRGAPLNQTPMVLHTNDVNTVFSHVEDLPHIDRDSLCCVMQRISESYVVERYELVAYQGVTTVTVVLANGGGRFDFRLNSQQ